MSKLYKRALTCPKSSFFLLGMRGAGKSTWVRELNLPAPLSINLLREDLYQRILANPLVFSGQLEKLPAGAWVFVDEIQRLPSILNDVHRFIEERKLKFILTGSSARKLRRNGVNLLGGRALVRHMFPLTPEEMGDDFDLLRTLEVGSLPLVVSSEETPRERLQAYVQTYLKEEIQAEALVRNLPGFARFLPVAALFHGQVINVSSLARDCGVERTTVSAYLDILEETLLAFRLPAFESKQRTRERKHPKLYWLDSGVQRAAKGHLSVPSPDERGHLLEGWVAQLLKAYQSYRGLFDELSYWAPVQAKTIEVDFLAKRGLEFCAIEVKASERIKEDHFKGLRALDGFAGLNKKYLVYMGTDRLVTPDGIHVVPALEFARILAEGTLF
jgi:predicted AAA+ superfamily ATPase